MPNLRSVFAQCYRLGGRSSQTRNLSSPPEANESVGEITKVALCRSFLGITLGSSVAYRMVGGKTSEFYEERDQALRELEQWEKLLSAFVSGRR
ncbi:hypothetical protein AALP_AA3G012900 [Arabis alpina]|uniref:Uncharacterized protein n=1 Tax=Arabis alpina TaxID=50452 RepID=A0A087H6B4_ARAAL|nr:hypothetical protein AALP_AA3G012900 [Arabis alpina]